MGSYCLVLSIGQFKRICKDAKIGEKVYSFIRNDKSRNRVRKIDLKSSQMNTHVLRHTYATRCIEARNERHCTSKNSRTR